MQEQSRLSQLVSSVTVLAQIVRRSSNVLVEEKLFTENLYEWVTDSRGIFPLLMEKIYWVPKHGRD